ncbi:DDX25 [Cordylochernes scorpioides]|uniref:RNA helicase n=1 Tax=Cordylochernes scorpioides TaxID=51811 RepID=A0ABY6KSK3_9ARAC|nr:DDX25 [Cordylochernes scorpioides]
MASVKIGSSKPYPSQQQQQSVAAHVASPPPEAEEEEQEKGEELTSQNGCCAEIGKAEESLMKKILRTRLVNNQNDLEVMRKNPNSPLYCVKSFEELNLIPELLKGVYQMGFTLPSKIQETALPTLLANPPQNMIAQSQSGTGKTAAFLLACLSRLDPNKLYPQVVILSPTYELAVQTGQVGEKMAKYCPNIKFCYAIRGVEMRRGEEPEAQVVIGTPGKILDWSSRLNILDLSKVICFVLDEADVMIDTQGHHDQSIRIHKKLDTNMCQMMFFSATYTPDVMNFAEVIVPNPIILRLKREEESLENIKQYYIECSSLEDKLNALSNIYGIIAIGQSIVFCKNASSFVIKTGSTTQWQVDLAPKEMAASDMRNRCHVQPLLTWSTDTAHPTKRTANWVVEQMSRQGHSVGLLSGDLTVEQRIAVLNRFREGKERVLITTNVCARGIDVEQVTLVANFDLPTKMDGHADCETYLHRIGRTGRFGKAGLAINMIDGRQSRQLLEEIRKHFGESITFSVLSY